MLVERLVAGSGGVVWWGFVVVLWWMGSQEQLLKPGGKAKEPRTTPQTQRHGETYHYRYLSNECSAVGPLWQGLRLRILRERLSTGMGPTS